VSILLATYNSPHRCGPQRLAKDMRRLAGRGVTLIGTQENTDGDPKVLAPPGWAWHRPKVARSAAVLWDTRTWRKVDAGQWRLHSPGWRTARYLVWVVLADRATGRRVRFGSAHLVAFKTRSQANGREFLHQQQRVAQWLTRGGQALRVVVGDFNGAPGGRWLRDLEQAGRHNVTLAGTGPRGQKIDHVWVPRATSATPRTVGTQAGASDHKALIVRV
jgi:hypothetical protein